MEPPDDPLPRSASDGMPSSRPGAPAVARSGRQPRDGGRSQGQRRPQNAAAGTANSTPGPWQSLPLLSSWEPPPPGPQAACPHGEVGEGACYACLFGTPGPPPAPPPTPPLPALHVSIFGSADLAGSAEMPGPAASRAVSADVRSFGASSTGSSRSRRTVTFSPNVEVVETWSTDDYARGLGQRPPDDAERPSGTGGGDSDPGTGGQGPPDQGRGTGSGGLPDLRTFWPR